MSAASNVSKSGPGKVDQFVHLHSHGDAGSRLDGFSTATEMVLEVHRLGQPAFALTDHGSLAGLGPLWNAIKYEREEHGYENLPKPIAGCEFYVVPSPGRMDLKEPVYLGDEGNDNRGSRDDVSARGAYTHLTVLAENQTGVRNLFHLNKEATARGWYKKPRVSLELFEQYHEGLIATTGCPSGEIQTEIRLGHFEKAVAYAARLVEIFGKGNVFVELMDHGMMQDLERKVRSSLIEIANRLNLPLVATNDLHYARHEDAKSHEEMLAMQTGGKMAEKPDYEGGSRFAFEGNGSYYIKSAAEMAQVFPPDQFPGALSNTLLIAERCSFEVGYDASLRPTVPIPDGYDVNEWLRKECFDGLARRLPDKVNDSAYIARLDLELNVFKEKNFPDYFLVTSDMIRWCKFRAEPRIPMGPGRGSAAGSLASFCLDITDVDPIRFELLFERFLNPERNSPPDIDIDISDRDRDRLIEYVRETYGEDQVAQVITYGTIKSKSAIASVARIYDYPIPVKNQLSKALPPAVFGREISLAEVYDPEAARYPEATGFRELVTMDHLEPIVEPARKLEGRVNTYGKHAAAMVISNKSLVDYIPVATLKEGERMVIQWDYPTAESMGLIKMDFLGLRNLSILQDAVANVKKTKGIQLDMTDLILGSMDDQKTYQMLQRGDSLGTFQLDGGGMRSLMKLLKPTTIDDISALVALYRPGPMGVNAHTDYALRKNGLQTIVPIHPELEGPLYEVLEPTQGIILYQEQIQKIAQIVADYSLGEADNLRRAMGKKKRAIIDKEFATFEPRAIAKGYSPAAIKALWDTVVPFADYAFNKSHSLSYGLTAYATAYMKANYTAEYMAATLTSVSGKVDKMAEYLEDCRQHHIKVLAPDINRSLTDFAPLSDTEISFGFKAIRNYGEKAADELVAFREANGPFTSFHDFLRRAPKTSTNKKALEALAAAGAFDGFEYSRRAVREGAEVITKTMQRIAARVKRAELKAAKLRAAAQEVDLFTDLEPQGPVVLSPEEQAELHNAFKTEVTFDALPEYPRLEKLKIEREFLALYVSDHPLNGLNLTGMASARVMDLLPGPSEEDEEGNMIPGEPPLIDAYDGWPPFGYKPIQIAGILTSLTARTTKKGDRMATGTFEDKSGGAIQVVFFPKTYQGVPGKTPGFGDMLKADGVYQLEGYSRTNEDGSEITFVVDRLKPLEFSDSGLRSVRFKAYEKQWARAESTVRAILNRYPAEGDMRTNVIISLADRETQKIREVTLDISVNPSPGLNEQMRVILGPKCVGRWIAGRVS